MKKLGLLFLLLPSLAFGAVTQAQVDQASIANQQMLDCYLAMKSYLSNVNLLFKSNFTLGIPGSTNTVTIPQAQQDEVVDLPKYQVKKACFVNGFNVFP